MKDVMGVIYTGENDARLRELTMTRAIAALPVLGRYRVIDFLVSSMVNGGMKNVGVIMQKNYHSLMDHLGSGKEWDLHGKNDGLYVLPPFLTRENVGVYSGMLDALRSNTNYLSRSKQEYLVLSGSNIIYNAKLDDLVRFHIDSGADITMMYIKVRPEHLEFSRSSDGNHCYLKVGEDKTIEDIEVNPNAANYPNLNMDCFIIKRTLLIHLVDQAIARGAKDLEGEVLRPYINSGALKIMGYEFEGYYRRIETIKGFFKFNMDLLRHDVRKELFGTHPVYTKTRDDAPALYRSGAEVKNSLVADGCVIEGSVENCVLFRGVHVGRGAKLKDCIIMQDSYIEEDVEMEDVILDKAVTVRAHGRLIGQRQYPIVIGKNVTL